MKELLIIAVGAAIVNNVVLSQFLGICAFLGVSKKTETAAGMGGAAHRQRAGLHDHRDHPGLGAGVVLVAGISRLHIVGAGGDGDPQHLRRGG